MDYHSARYKKIDTHGKLSEEGDCDLALVKDGLFVRPKEGKEFYLYYSDIERITDLDNQLDLLVYGGLRYILYYLGSYYGKFVSDLTLKRNYQLQKNLLMLDINYQKKFQGTFEYTDSEGKTIKDDTAKIVLYQNSLVVIPQKEDLFNINYCDIEKIDFDSEKFSLNISLDLGEKLVLTMMGERFEEFQEDIKRLIEEMYQRNTKILEKYLPKGISEWTIIRLSRALKQGKVTKKSEIEKISKNLWKIIQGIIFKRPGEEINREPDKERKFAFDYLSSLAGPEDTYIGIRESFTSSGEELKPIFWFLVAIPEKNAIAFEVTNEEGHATYFFKIKKGGNPESSEVEKKAKEINRSMQALNFKKEVICASEEEIKTEKFRRYWVALRKLPYLNRIRKDFLGRAIHTSRERWKNDVQEILERATKL